MKLLVFHVYIYISQNRMNCLTEIYNPTPISSSSSSSGGLKNDCKIASSCGCNGQSTLGTSTILSSSTIDGPFQSIPNSKLSS